MQLVTGLGYEALRIVQDSATGALAGLETVTAFPDATWDDRSSPYACDYLFVPKGQAEAAREVLCS
jgi:endonuclease/exonuclease/phosphatase family metal-dependent hydrolase